MAAVTQTNPLKPSQLPREESPRAIHDWASLAVSEGEAFLQSQNGIDDIPKIIDAIMGNTRGNDLLRSTTMSGLSLNHMGKIGLDLASSLTDIKPFWEYRTNNDRFELQSTMAQKLATAWWSNRLIDLKFCDVIKYACAAGSGYANLFYNQETDDLDLQAEDPRDVLPIRPTDNFSVQSAFGQIVRRERTVNYLRQMYPDKANKIRADRDGSFAALSKNTRYAQLIDRMGINSGFVKNLMNSLGGRSAATPLNVPVADVFTICVKDDSVNMTGETKIMGDPSTNWAYVVQPGEPLYPRKRMIVMCRSCPEPLYDGPNIYWHGMFTALKLTLDPWPWSWLGKSPMRDLLPIQGEINRSARGISDMLEQLWRPALIGDKNSVSKQLMDKIDTRKAGLKMRTNPVAGQGVRLEYPPVEKLAQAYEWIKFLIEQGKELSGTQELSSLAQLGQLPSSETIERMIESMSPAIRLRSRVMEAFLREMAMMTLMNFFQFYSTKKRVTILGAKQGLTFEDFDYDPDSMVPDMKEEHGSILPRHERAVKFIDNFAYQIAPGSLLAASEVTDKLMYLQLTRMGGMDMATLLEKLGVPNLGLPADFPQGIFPRLQWFAQQQIALNGGPAGVQGQPGGGPGRPASAQAMPSMHATPEGIKITESK